MLNKTLKLALDSREDFKNYRLLNTVEVAGDETFSDIMDTTGIQAQSSEFVGNIPYIDVPYSFVADIYKKDSDTLLKEKYHLNIMGSSTNRYWTEENNKITFHRYYNHVTNAASNAPNKIRVSLLDPEAPTSSSFNGNIGTNHSMLVSTELVVKALNNMPLVGGETPSSLTNWNTEYYICPRITYNQLKWPSPLTQYEPYLLLKSFIQTDDNFSEYFNLTLEEENEDYLGWYKLSPKMRYNFTESDIEINIWYENSSYSRSNKIKLIIPKTNISQYYFTVLDAGEYKLFNDASNVNVEISNFNYRSFTRHVRLEGTVEGTGELINLYPYMDNITPKVSYRNISSYMIDNVPTELTRDDKNERFTLSIPVEYIQRYVPPIDENNDNRNIEISISCKRPNSTPDADGIYHSVSTHFNIIESLPEVAKINPIKGYEINGSTHGLLNFSDSSNPISVGIPDTSSYVLRVEAVDKNGNTIENYPCFEYPNYKNAEAEPYNAVALSERYGITNNLKYNFSMRPEKGYCLNDSNQSHAGGTAYISIGDKRRYDPHPLSGGTFTMRIDGGRLVNDGKNAEQHFYYRWNNKYYSSTDETGGMTINFKNSNGSMGTSCQLFVYGKLAYGSNNTERGLPVDITSFFEFEPKTISDTTNSGIELNLNSSGTITIPTGLVPGQTYTFVELIKAKLKSDPTFTIEGSVTFILQP